MKSLATARLAVLLVFAAACGCRAEPASDEHRAPLEHVLVGQLLLPPGAGSRGVEVLVVTAPSGGEPGITWVLFDEQGFFSHTFTDAVTRVTVTAGAEVYRVDAEDLPEVNQAGRIDLGLIDMRDRLMRHRLMVRVADGKAPGEVRVGMFSGPPPVGPFGEPVSLGSRQFPPVALDSEMEWLVPKTAQGIYFLVERPAGSGRGLEWRSGQQSLFGPFTSAELPAELIVK
ncbi:MAG: hypothetical protein IPJ24_17925 [bacterium]|nr:hypothetical protein [bacterium]